MLKKKKTKTKTTLYTYPTAKPGIPTKVMLTLLIDGINLTG